MAIESEKRVVIAIYTHPEFYPPLLNVIDGLSDVYRQILVISRNLKAGKWQYPEAVEMRTSGKKIPILASEQASTIWKIKSFLLFTRLFYLSVKRERSSWVMCNDPISLLSFRIIRPWIGYRVQLWYHNHDVAELKSMRRFSIGYFAVKSEKKYFKQIDLFTIPSEERLEFFPLNRLRGKWLVVPNYPSVRRMGDGTADCWKPGEDLKLIYQGRVSNEHGLEEILDFIKSDSSVRLTIVGPGDENYILGLRNKLAALGIEKRVSILDPVPYSDLRAITCSHHVGLAVNKPMNILYSTAGLASNKIYEYASAGLPVIFYQDTHYKKILENYPWAFPTDLSIPNLSTTMRHIRENGMEISQEASRDFKMKLNFEFVFKPVFSLLSGVKMNVSE